MPTAREWLQANRTKYTDRSKWIHDCCTSTGVSIKTIRNVACKEWANGGSGKKAPVVSKGDGMNRQAFLAKYDDNTRIRNAIRKGIPTLAGPKADEDDILEEAKFRLERCDCANTVGFRPIAEEPEFVKYQFRVSDKVFWTTPRTREWALQNVTKAREV